MTRYYMQLRDDTEQLIDPEGLEYADVDDLKKKVLIAAREIIAADAQCGVIDFRFHLDAEDRDGVIVYTLGFSEAVKIVSKEE